MRSVTAAFLSLLVCTAASAQMSEVIEVRVTNVDVVVTDHAGNPITGLTKDDFQLFENGKRQTITNFYEVRADVPKTTATDPSAPPPAVVSAEVRRRSVLVFVDATSIEPYRRNQAVEAVRKGLNKLLRPGDDAMIVNWNRSVEVVQPFTADLGAVNKGVDALKERLGNAASLVNDRNMVISFAADAISRSRSSRGRYPIAQAYSDSIASWTAYAENIRHTEKTLIDTTGQMLSTLASDDSKKVFIFVGGELQDRPGIDALQQIDSMFQGAGYLPQTPALLRDTERNLRHELDVLAHRAAAQGAAMYMIDASDRRPDASMDYPATAESAFTAESSTLLTMGAIASLTGGTVLSGTRNYDVALNNVARDLGSYYSLGYKPAAEGPADRNLTVKVTRPGATARSRRAYGMKSADDQMADRVISNVFHDTARGDFEIAITTGEPERFERSYFKVPVTVTFPSTLTYVPDGADMTGGYTVVFVTATTDGAISQVGRQENTVRFPANSYFSVKAKPFTHTANLVVRPGKQSISVAVVDKLGARAGFAKVTIDVR